ncbi:MAG: flippase-like domain-containing protein [Kofleriaceae bacterium]|nr:flippase-like domain-containing protein [Kofleriaceae bacterium]
MTEPVTSRQGFRIARTHLVRAVGVGIVVLLFVWQRDRVFAAGQLLKHADPLYWGLAAVLQFTCLYIAAIRLGVLLRAVGHSIPQRTLYADLVCAFALNTAMFLGVGDLYRVKRTNQHVGNIALVSGVIVLDRIFGLAMICALAVVSLAIIQTQSDAQSTASGFQLHYSHLLLALALFVVAAAVVRIIAKRSNHKLWRDIQRPFIAVVARPFIGLKAALASMGLSLVWLASIVLVARALGIEAPILALVFAATVVAVATVLPVSIGGIGLREAGYTLLLASYGVETAQAIALGVAQYALFLPVMMAGAVIGTIRYRSQDRAQAPEQATL